MIPFGYNAGSLYASQNPQYDLEAADLDGDGKLDFIVPIPNKNLLQIFYGKGDGTFEPVVTLPTAQDVHYVTVADVDQDGIPDLVLSGNALVRILHGLGQRRFEATPTSYAANPYPQKVRVADVNHDGNLDLLVPNGTSNLFAAPGDGFTVLLNAAPPTSPDLLIPALGCSPEPSSLGQAFTCTAAFTPAANPASPAGSVSFTLDGTAAGSAVLAGNKAALVFPSNLAAGAHAITATFPGDANFRAALASITHAVSLASATLLLTEPTHVAYGEAVPLQAALSGSFGVPAGTVTFLDGAASLAQSPVVGGLAAFSTSGLTPGTHLLQASYGGDTTYAATLSNTLTVVVDPQPTSLLLQVAPVTAPFGSAIALQATLSATSGPLSGTVQFFDGSAQIGTGSVDSSGNAHFSTTGLSLGTHTLLARFPGTTSLAANASNGVLVTITGIATSTSLTTTPNPSYPGQSVTLLATLVAPGSPQALAGTVRFLDGNTLLGEAALNANGIASLAISTLAVGTHTLTAGYLGSSPLVASQSGAVQQVVLNSSFTLDVEPGAITLQTQHHTTIALKVTPVGVFSGLVNLGCGTLPQHATCLLKPQSGTLTPAGGAQSVSVYLDTSDVIGYAGNGRAPLSRQDEGRFCAVFLLPLLAGCGLAGRRKHLWGRLLMMVTAGLFLALGAVGCSGKYPASVAPGDYTITFTGSSATSPSKPHRCSGP